MPYGTPMGPLNPIYSVSVRHDALTMGGSPMPFFIEARPEDVVPEDADALFQKLLDLINSTEGFQVMEPVKRFEHRQVVTPS